MRATIGNRMVREADACDNLVWDEDQCKDFDRDL